MRISSVLILGIVFQTSATAQVATTVSTFKNEQLVGVRKVEGGELRGAAVALIGAFQESSPSYEHLVDIAKGMMAKNRCFNLYSAKFTLASIQAGKLDASQNVENSLKNSISSIDAVNSQTQVTCVFAHDKSESTSASARVRKPQDSSSLTQRALHDVELQDCLLVTGTLAIVPLWRDNNVPISRAQENISNVLAKTGLSKSEKKQWYELVGSIYSSPISSGEVERHLRPRCVGDAK